MILLILRAPTRTFLKKSFYVIPAFSDFFFFSKLAFIWLRVFFFLSHLFFYVSHIFLFDYCVPKKVTKWYKKEKGLSNDVSLTITFLLLHIHSIGRGDKVGFIFVLFWESLWVKLLQRLEKKRLRKWLICESLFFSWSHDVVRCCGNCPKYSFCFFVFFRGTKFYGQSIIHLYRAANFFVFLIFWFSEKYTIKCGVFCCCRCCKKTWEIIIFWRRIWNDWE